MNPIKYLDLKQAIIDAGYEHDVTWAENVKKCDNSFVFLNEYVWVMRFSRRNIQPV